MEYGEQRSLFILPLRPDPQESLLVDLEKDLKCGVCPQKSRIAVHDRKRS
jgi:hypothetical protein